MLNFKYQFKHTNLNKKMGFEYFKNIGFIEWTLEDGRMGWNLHIVPVRDHFQRVISNIPLHTLQKKLLASIIFKNILHKCL